MAITKIKVSNFKSFKNLEIELGVLNVLIGSNASGKSNFIQIFKFLRDITNFGLENAISMQGGIEYFRNINIAASELFSITVISNQEFGFMIKEREGSERLVAIEIYETIYEFVLKFKKGRLGFEIISDKLIQKCAIIEVERQIKRIKKKEKFVKKIEIKKKEKLGSGEIILSRHGDKVKIDKVTFPKGIMINKDDIFPLVLREERLSPKDLLLKLSLPFVRPLERELINVAIYDFDPKLPKESTPITGKAELEEDGKNLAIVLNNIVKTKDKYRKFSNLIKELLPFMDKVEVDRFADKSLLFKIREIYSKTKYLPASLISDGTVNIIALIIALYFEEKSLTIIEEPERNIHPYLISKVIDMIKDASLQKKQIIVTTHNPEVVKHTDLKNILLVSRDKEGFSAISRPGDKKEVKIFLKNEIGIEELYVQNLLGV